MAGKTAPAFGNRWTNTDGEMRAYVRSKVIAERAAWDFMAADLPPWPQTRRSWGS